jgi:type I restriction enzyme M protein
MSYEEFRRRIDTARNILVGAVPSPAGQIDQITYAMMYKFMNDIDDQAAALGGNRSYFIGDYEQYNWHKLMSSSLGAHERLELYRQAIQTMAKNPNIPELFRSIYQNAFLPFNSPNVLNLFLKEIDKFNHGESDDIGDAYEYLLSITGAQGDVGQFRTPRHIIKFIVEAVNPTKDDTVIDPACGTAGFLISAYNHVRAQHDGKNADGSANDEQRLTASELDKIHHNYRGFDIDPTMVRTAKVNLYLHGFKTPEIINHDSLSSEEYWNDRYDVILANPPFMTPKGGIQPHKKFGISANRAEVLFVDYIASHLKPTGRAGIIVPEGVIFQSGKAYKELRKNLVENSLYAVISLPSGVFNPYAGVKTSILLLDKELAKQNDEVLFVKVENDGYSLGAQRRPLAGDQFPEALEVIERFKNGEELQTEFAHAVKKDEIAGSGDYNLSGDRYKIQKILASTDIELARVGDIITENVKSTIKVGDAKVSNGSMDFFTSGREQLKYDESLVTGENIFLATGGNANAFYSNQPAAYSTDTWSITSKSEDKALTKYIYYNLSNRLDYINTAMFKGAGLKHLDKHLLRDFKIPLPPIEIQREIVAELDGYQKIIDAAQTIVKTYKPTIKINPEWSSASPKASR